MTKIVDIIKTVDAKSFKPQILITFQADLEQLQDDKSTYGDKAYNMFAKDLFNKVDLFEPERTPGIALYHVDMPITRVEYFTKSNDSFTINLQAETAKSDDLNLERLFTEIAGENADIFLMSIRSAITIDNDTLKRKMYYLVRFASVSEEFRKEKNLKKCISHRQNDFF
jgi:hypothetical protein